MKNLVFIFAIMASLTACKDTDKASDLNQLAKGQEDFATQKRTDYAKPFCEMISEEIIRSIFTDAHDFEYESTDANLPLCFVSYSNSNTGGGITLKGYNDASGPKHRRALERKLEGEGERQKLDNLGDEAYLFPRTNFARIMVMKDGLSYNLEYTNQDDTVHEDGIKLMREIMKHVD